MAARPVGLPGTSRGVLGSSSDIKPMPGPMWLRYGLNAILGHVASEGVIENVVLRRERKAETGQTKHVMTELSLAFVKDLVATLLMLWVFYSNENHA